MGEIARRSDVLTAARLGASCTNYFKTVLKLAWEKAMLVGLPCVLEEKVLLWGQSSEQSTAPWPWLHVDSAIVADVER